MMQIAPPNSVDDLKQRCATLVGKNIFDLAKVLDIKIPSSLSHAKGWVGQLIEAYLGASAGSKAQPDFPHLGIELKTIPVDKHLKPLESTYVCTVQANQSELVWRNSWVYRKLEHVLWVPICDHIVGTPILWRMDAASEEILRNDWQELMELLELGHAQNLSAKFGTYLHIRPKAANNRVLIDYLTEDGLVSKLGPKGFYLRTSFTKQVLNVLF